MFLRIVSCEVALREICWAVAQTQNVVDLEFLPVGHHDEPEKGRVNLQQRIDAVPPNTYDAILVGYGLCNKMLCDITAPHTQLVIPRAHDCLTFFLGSKERYQEVFFSHPGTYYYTAGWLEFPKRREREQRQAGAKGKGRTTKGEIGCEEDEQELELPSQSQPSGSAKVLGKPYEQLVAEYGEENAQYLMDVMGRWVENYRRGALIALPLDGQEALRKEVTEVCQRRGWEYEEIPGDLSLLKRWVNAEWSEEDFLIVPPGCRVVATYDERVIDVG